MLSFCKWNKFANSIQIFTQLAFILILLTFLLIYSLWKDRVLSVKRVQNTLRCANDFHIKLESLNLFVFCCYSEVFTSAIRNVAILINSILKCLEESFLGKLACLCSFSQSESEFWIVLFTFQMNCINRAAALFFDP